MNLFKRKSSFLILFIFFVGTCLYANSLDNLEIDVKNFSKFGYRPISLGTEYFINSQGGFHSEYENYFTAAISSKGFFAFYDKENDKILFSRNGSFLINKEGFLINQDNYYVLSNESNIDENEYVFLSNNDFKELNTYLNKKDTKEKIKNFLFVSPSKAADCTIIDGQYIYFTNFIIEDAKVILSCREYNPLSFDELYNIILEEFKKFNKPIYKTQKKRILLELRLQTEITFNNSYYTLEIQEAVWKKIEELEKSF